MRLVKHRGKWAAYINGSRYSTGIDIATDRGLAERKARDILAALATPIGRTSAEILSAYVADMPRRAIPKAPTSGLLCAYAPPAPLGHFSVTTSRLVSQERNAAPT